MLIQKANFDSIITEDWDALEEKAKRKDKMSGLDDEEEKPKKRKR